MARARLEIDVAAVAANWRLIKRQVGNLCCAAVVKADAYGLGARSVVESLFHAGCQQYFTATLDEALSVRRLLDNVEIFVLDGPTDDPRVFTANRLVPVLNHLGQIRQWSQHAFTTGRSLSAAIHVDTGMNRLGMPGPELKQLCGKPELLDGIAIRLIMSHLACAEESDNELNQTQLRRFTAVSERLPTSPVSLANSSGIFLGPDYHFDLVRPGYALYGGNPVPDRANPMNSVVRLSTQIVQVRELTCSETVGYGATHVVSRPTRVATIPIGYADGYLRSFSNRGYVMIGDNRVPVIGRVSMDLVTIDIGGLPEQEAHVGTRVDVFSGADMIDDLAARAGTIGYEILTSLGSRYERVYLEENRSCTS